MFRLYKTQFKLPGIWVSLFEVYFVAKLKQKCIELHTSSFVSTIHGANIDSLQATAAAAMSPTNINDVQQHLQRTCEFCDNQAQAEPDDTNTNAKYQIYFANGHFERLIPSTSSTNLRQNRC